MTGGDERARLGPAGSLCVFCGAHSGRRPEYRRAAKALGRELAARDLRLVFGGGGVGLMGIVADAVLERGGEVTGVIPRRLATAELLHPRVVDCRVVETMHERKALMAELSDAFLALPGGYGTFDELFEALTWRQLGLSTRPIGLLDIAGFFSPFLTLVDRAIEEGFLRPAGRELFVREEEPTGLLDALELL